MKEMTNFSSGSPELGGRIGFLIFLPLLGEKCKVLRIVHACEVGGGTLPQAQLLLQGYQKFLYVTGPAKFAVTVAPPLSFLVVAFAYHVLADRRRVEGDSGVVGVGGLLPLSLFET